MKICTKCKLEKKLIEFPKDKQKKDGLHPYCKACHAVYWLHKDKGPSYKDKVKIYQKRFKIRSYGLTEEDYDRLLKIQNGVCAICHKPETHNRSKVLSIDHCHKTNKVRGLLCHRCNAGLGQFYDDTEIMKSAINYLERS
jgi:Autographiviridae endonuclease VII